MKTPMEPLLFAIVGGIIGYLIGRGVAQPHYTPPTTSERLKAVPPKCKVCLMCDDVPQPGSYFCADCEKENVRA